MSGYKLNINMKRLDDQFHSFVAKSPTAKKLTYQIFNTRFQSRLRTMLSQFDRHPVTLEINAGPLASNISQTLDGYGNLFSFIGFESDSKPTEELREALVKNTDFVQRQYRANSGRFGRGWEFVINVPSRKEIEAVTQMPWEGGNSWAFGVEEGISGLSHYMFQRWGGSRSKEAFQLPYENMEDAIFAPVPYISKILQSFRDRINKL